MAEDKTKDPVAPEAVTPEAPKEVAPEVKKEKKKAAWPVSQPK